MEELTLTVLATDNIHDPRRLASTTVNVQLVHSNQNRPRFPACDMYKPSVREESSVGTEVLKVAAIDEDSGEEGVIEYSIVQVPGATRSNFVIDANTGQIRTLRSFDRDEPVSERRLTLPIRATDKGRPPLDAICMITVEVQDINDNPPLFDQTRYEVNVPQDASVGSDWLRLAAMDHDEGLNSEVSFSLEHHERDGFFQVDNKTGVLKLIRPLNSVRPESGWDI
ncbi:unnamed protein product [Cyprideis torosa]|uniref:Uncharacterized protein n=1 Tax=Cyprideis torosa TaxID=163714 RepID=A0A7R8ZVH2_9CRUS|nr:unnamed protein product [Cyprideis torosa]CAG0907544.1 unnamed protein product [Cyprideis torosa]